MHYIRKDFETCKVHLRAHYQYWNTSHIKLLIINWLKNTYNDEVEGLTPPSLSLSLPTNTLKQCPL